MIDLTVVGIGASAGGLDALQRVLPGLPDSAGMAYIIVQHLAPKHHTMLPSLLEKHTNMPLETIEDGMSVQADTVYITPPNKDVMLNGSRFKLTEASKIGPRPSIDYFFTSLAEQKQARAVGIILSGTGTDGAHGIRAIKSNDGITMAQTPDSAKFDGMPQAAVNTGLVDLVLPPEKLGREIENALKYPHLIAGAPAAMDADEIDSLLGLLFEKTGVDFKNYKRSTIQRRISRRMVIQKLDSLQDYVDYAQSHPEELPVLQKDLLISVTSFFRDRQAFDHLSGALRRLFQNKSPGDSFRAWVPGCATGEEAYSIAILLAEVVGSALDKYRIQIFATDLDEDAIQMARKGEYPLATVLETDGQRFEKHFSHSDNVVKIKKRLRDMVVFSRQDLVKDTPFMHLDLISCRNLMIYLNAELQDQLLALFQYSLNPEGILFLGKSESINRRMDLFSTIDNKWKIFKRKEGSPRRFPQLVKKQHAKQLTTHSGISEETRGKRTMNDMVYFDSLLGLIDSCGVVTDESGDILYIRGDVSPYCRFPEGMIRQNLNVIDVARPELRYILQSMLHKSMRKAEENRTLTSNRIPLGGNGQGVRIKIGPIRNKKEENCLLIVFSPVQTRTKATKNAPTDDADHDRIRELEQELDITREHLQDTIEELETSGEELQSLNEELQSANEELQASNEELETSNEELQASNEELNTVNDELRAKSQEANDLLENYKDSEERYRLLINNMNEAVMLCEIEYGPQNKPTDLVIRQANRALLKLINIDRDDIPLRAGSAKLDELIATDMLDRLTEVVESDKAQRFELHTAAIGKDLEISVYRLRKNRIGILCRDETKRKQAEDRLCVAKDAAEIGLHDYNVSLGNIFGDDRFRELWGVGPEVPITYDLFMDGLHPDDREPTQQRIDNALSPNGNGKYYAEYRVIAKDSGIERWVAATGRVRFESGKAVQLVGTVQNITERKRSEDELRKSRDRLRKTLGEKEVLIKEIHHRVKNNLQVILSLLSLQTTVANDEATKIILNEISNRVRSMSLVHEKLYQSADLSALGFDGYTHNLLKNLWHAYATTASGVELTTHLEPIQLSLDKAVPCGLILNELVSNALKHAFNGHENGELNVALMNDKKRGTILSVSDNGIGLPPDFDWRQAETLGLRLVRMLAKQLNGDIAVNGDNGTTITVSFKGLES